MYIFYLLKFINFRVNLYQNNNLLIHKKVCIDHFVIWSIKNLMNFSNFLLKHTINNGFSLDFRIIFVHNNLKYYFCFIQQENSDHSSQKMIFLSILLLLK